MKKVIGESIENGFTDVVIINEDKHQGANGMLISHLPNGPTAAFKLTNVVFPKLIPVCMCDSQSVLSHGYRIPEPHQAFRQRS